MEILLNQFFKTGKITDAVNMVIECRNKGMNNLGLTLGKQFITLFPKNIEILIRTAYCAFDSANYSECYDLMGRIADMSTDEKCIQVAAINQSTCVPFIMDKYIEYPSELVEKIKNKPISSFPLITFTMTTCKRFDLFEKTMNSFLNCCQDVFLIDKWFIVDDNSSEEDREKMRINYPFVQFYFKNRGEKGHPQSMNIIRDNVKTPYIFHLEDDWKFFCKRNFLIECLEVLSQSDKIGQCLINKNYGETAQDMANLAGGIFSKTEAGFTYYIHEHCGTQDEQSAFDKKYFNSPNCAYWKHFSFRPSLLRRSILEELGPFDEKVSHFEAAYAEKYKQAGYVSAFLNRIFCLHIGRLTSERFDETKKNAYILNDEKQYSGKESTITMESEVTQGTSREVTQIQPTLKNPSFVVNLDRRPDRWEKFKKIAEQTPLLYTRFPAIDGNKLKPNKQLQRIFEGNDYYMRKGMVGCALSHISLWIQLLNSQSEYFCIFEDDIDFVPNFYDKITHVYKILPPDYDICFLGHHLWKEHRPEGIANLTRNPYDKEAYPILEKWDTNKSLQTSMGGTGGYIISKKGARKMLEYIEELGMINGIDTMMQKAADTLNVYYCSPHLIYSECYNYSPNSDTDIQKDFNSLDLLEEVDKKEYPERLKKRGIWDINEAIRETKQAVNNPIPFYIVPLSETTHTYEAIKQIYDCKIQFPFDKTDKGNFEDFYDIIKELLEMKDENDIVDLVNNFYPVNKYGIRFCHEQGNNITIKEEYKQRFLNLKRAIESDIPIVFVHVSRWHVSTEDIFKKFIDLFKGKNDKVKILTINGLIKVQDEKYKNYIVVDSLEFPKKFYGLDWPPEMIEYDQRYFRTGILPILKKYC